MILVNEEDGKPIKQQPRGHSYVATKYHRNCFTLILPIEEQIQFFIQHHDVIKKIKAISKLGDVTSGQCYQDVTKELEHVVTVLWNIDGAKCYEASKYGFWPFMGVINEASYEIRRSCVILLLVYGLETRNLQWKHL